MLGEPHQVPPQSHEFSFSESEGSSSLQLLRCSAEIPHVQPASFSRGETSVRTPGAACIFFCSRHQDRFAPADISETSTLGVSSPAVPQVSSRGRSRDGTPLCVLPDSTDPPTELGFNMKMWLGLALLLYPGPELFRTTLASPGIEPRCEAFSYHPVCPMVLQPLCGSNGVTFTSLCNLCLYNWGTGFRIKILHEGPCGSLAAPTQFKIKRSNA
ncbi:uncharacterized protein LOC132385564 [Hypanus sabinus]|uniref:uncharacterized protein LOC132383714 n=1 Tax=Hypanus sabinus TaxID=79690 RepID=UPI0028C43053|nr:uncharacterized protein LOC132383714 [Hypanus sabinus]XP_059813713.1 uncharacterized protein LOC132385564 [Hypanus sabinus]